MNLTSVHIKGKNGESLHLTAHNLRPDHQKALKDFIQSLKYHCDPDDQMDCTYLSD